MENLVREFESLKEAQVWREHYHEYADFKEFLEDELGLDRLRELEDKFYKMQDGDESTLCPQCGEPLPEGTAFTECEKCQVSYQE